MWILKDNWSVWNKNIVYVKTIFFKNVWLCRQYHFINSGKNRQQLHLICIIHSFHSLLYHDDSVWKPSAAKYSSFYYFRYERCFYHKHTIIIYMFIVECRYNTVQKHELSLQWLKQNIHQSLNHKRHPMSHPSSLAMGFCCEDFGENWPRYNGTALYMLSFRDHG